VLCCLKAAGRAISKEDENTFVAITTPLDEKIAVLRKEVPTHSWTAVRWCTTSIGVYKWWIDQLQINNNNQCQQSCSGGNFARQVWSARSWAVFQARSELAPICTITCSFLFTVNVHMPCLVLMRYLRSLILNCSTLIDFEFVWWFLLDWCSGWFVVAWHMELLLCSQSIVWCC
jgi:hypothetical protein